MKISPEYILLIRCCRKTDYFNAARWCKTYWPKTKLVCLTHKDLIEALQAEELADRIIELPPGDIGKESISGMLSEIRKLAGKGCFVIPSGPRLRSQFKNIIALLPMIKPAYGSLFIKDTGELQWCNRPESFWEI